VVRPPRLASLRQQNGASGQMSEEMRARGVKSSSASPSGLDPAADG
jgi:hypothetical protein